MVSPSRRSVCSKDTPEHTAVLFRQRWCSVVNGVANGKSSTSPLFFRLLSLLWHFPSQYSPLSLLPLSTRLFSYSLQHKNGGSPSIRSHPQLRKFLLRPIYGQRHKPERQDFPLKERERARLHLLGMLSRTMWTHHTARSGFPGALSCSSASHTRAGHAQLAAP